MLTSLGFPPEAEQVYRLLLTDSQLTDSQVAANLGLAEEQAASIRAKLVETGLVRRSWEDDDRMVVVHPELIVDRAIKAREAELARQQETLAASRSGLQFLVTDYLAATAQPQRVGEAVELIGLDAIREVLERWSARAEREVLAMHPTSEHSQSALDTATALDLSVLARGVRMRSIYPEASRADEGTVGYHRTVVAHGAEVRYARRVPTRMIVFDRRTGLIPLHSTDTGRAAVLLEGEAITAILALTFEQAWSVATPLEPEQDEAPGGTAAAQLDDDPSDLDRTLLQLMSMGVKDEAAARHLGVSVRTVRRQIADLMTRLEAGSRFEAGVRAAMRGWLGPADR